MGPGEEVSASVVNLSLQHPCTSAVAESVFLTDNLWLRYGTLIKGFFWEKIKKAEGVCRFGEICYLFVTVGELSCVFHLSVEAF